VRGWLALAALMSFMVSTAATASCTSGSVSPMALGTYTGAQSTAGATSNSVTCPNGTAFTIGLNNGTGTGATATNRQMTLGAATLSYRLFQDAAGTLNFGNIGGSDVLSGTGTGTSQPFTIYPLIPSGQFVAPGTYVDTITASAADSGTISGTFTVTATVQAACALSATPLAFGTYAGVLSNSSSTLTITCTNSTTYNIGLSAGLATGATVTNRSMTGPASALLGYKLFSNSGHTTNWGNTVGTDTVAGTGSGAAQPLTVYGQIPGGQSARPGSYADTIIATITY